MNTFTKHLLHFPKHPKKTPLDDVFIVVSGPVAVGEPFGVALGIASAVAWSNSSTWFGASESTDTMKMSNAMQCLLKYEMLRYELYEDSKIPLQPFHFWLNCRLPRSRIRCCGTPHSGGHSSAGHCHRSNSV